MHLACAQVSSAGLQIESLADLCCVGMAESPDDQNTNVNTGRDQNFLKHTMIYARGIFESAGIINLFPKWLRPFVAPLIVKRLKKHVDICKKIAMPIVQNRLDEALQGERGRVHVRRDPCF